MVCSRREAVGEREFTPLRVWSPTLPKLRCCAACGMATSSGQRKLCKRRAGDFDKATAQHHATRIAEHQRYLRYLVSQLESRMKWRQLEGRRPARERPIFTLDLELELCAVEETPDPAGCEAVLGDRLLGPSPLGRHLGGPEVWLRGSGLPRGWLGWAAALAPAAATPGRSARTAGQTPEGRDGAKPQVPPEGSEAVARNGSVVAFGTRSDVRTTTPTGYQEEHLGQAQVHQSRNWTAGTFC